MMKVTLRLPASLLRRFRELAAELSLDADHDIAFHEMVEAAATEAVYNECLEAPPASLVPLLSVEAAVPDAAVRSVAHLARRSGLTLEQAWCRVVLEFCERSEAPGLGSELKREAA